MSLKHGILGFLNYGSMSGYDLSKAFGSSVQFFWHAQNSQIYLVLDKLEKEHLITHETVMQSDRPNKKVYTVTEDGRQEFLNWLSGTRENATNEFKSAFLMKIFFSGNLPPSENLARLKKFQADCADYLNNMASIPKSIDHYRESVDSYAALYWGFTADFGHRYLNMCMDWAGDCIRKLEKLS